MNFAFYFKRAHAAQNVQMPPNAQKNAQHTESKRP
jgi:hypothetical protein